MRFSIGVRFGIPAQAPIQFRQAQIDKQEFLPLVPVLEDGRIGVGAANAPVAARRHLQQRHPIHDVAHHRRILHDAEVDDRKQRAIDIVLHRLLPAFRAAFRRG